MQGNEFIYFPSNFQIFQCTYRKQIQSPCLFIPTIILNGRSYVVIQSLDFYKHFNSRLIKRDDFSNYFVIKCHGLPVFHLSLTKGWLMSLYSSDQRTNSKSIALTSAHKEQTHKIFISYDSIRKPQPQNILCK